MRSFSLLTYSSGSSWLKIFPAAIRRLMVWLKGEYGNKYDIYVTENGFSDLLGNTDDLMRVYYYKHYINQLLKGKIKYYGTAKV